MKKFSKYLVITALVTSIGLGVPSVTLAATAVNLGTADAFAILAGTSVTNVPVSAITGDVGLSPAAGSNYGAGVTTSQVTGTIYAVDSSGPAGAAGNNPALLTSAKNDLVTAYTNAAGQTATTTYAATENQLGSKTLTPGVYTFGHGDTANLIGTLTLDGQGDPNAVFIFQASSDLVTASSSVVALTNGVQACNVFWQVSSSATLGTSSAFVGTIMALTSIGLNTGASLTGRALARNAAVTLQQNTITRPSCAAATATPTPTASVTATPTSGTATPTATASGAATPVSLTTTTSTPLTTTPVPGLPGTGFQPEREKSIPSNVAFLVIILILITTLFTVVLGRTDRT